MVEVPPGVAFIATKALKLSIPVVAVHFILTSICVYLDRPVLSFPAFLALVSILALPGVAVTRRVKNFHNNRKAAARGEILPPAVRDPWPFNIGFLVKTIKAFQSGYVGSAQTGFGPLVSGSARNASVLPTCAQTYFTTEPSHIKAILATRFDDWEKGAIFHGQMKSVLGVGVFNSDGDMWRFHRAMTRPFFNKERISDFDIFDEHALDAIAQAKQRLAAGYPVDFQDMCSRISLDSATAFLFNNDVHSLSAGLIYPPGTPEAANSDRAHQSIAFAHAFSDCQRQVAFRTFLGEVWPLSEMTVDVTKPNMKIVNNFIEPLVAKALREKKLATTSGKTAGADNGEREHLCLLDLLVGETDGVPIIHPERLMLIGAVLQTLNIMIAGRDTIAAALAFGAYMLAENPHVLKRLRQEILEVVGPVRRPTYDDIKGMKYMRAFINETLRLYPPVPFDVRSAVRDTTFPPSIPSGTPYFVPKGTECIYSVFLMHRRTELWGPDALVFDPDRFIDERVHKYLTPNPFIFLPFNAGPRICLGQQFAYNEISFTLVRLLQTFDSISLARDAQPPDSIPPVSWAKAEGRQAIEKIVPKQHITMYCDGGLWVRMGEASAAEVV
ncbi:cytochrome P450 monooxygenase pc-3 [Vararia minispora EC-137]|uniref:Cytochrome P450 monooxygenase pc-3 n=1 Tax=Vararia minispora EC-137 TaxID=1314806 RepID=A0ACB8QG84_9AGAM|nr:cytochrome P450 monooxygenase pc-3 [Vararia minispora EC-137]